MITPKDAEKATKTKKRKPRKSKVFVVAWYAPYEGYDLSSAKTFSTESRANKYLEALGSDDYEVLGFVIDDEWPLSEVMRASLKRINDRKKKNAIAAEKRRAKKAERDMQKARDVIAAGEKK